MMISNQEQLWRLFCYLGCGVFAGIYLSLFYAWKHISSPSKWFLFLHDCLFCVVVTLILFLFSLAVEGGHLRLASLAAVGAGAASSYAVLHRVALGVFKIFGVVFRSISRAWERLTSFFAKKLRFFAKKVTIFLKKGLRSLYKVVYNH